ncbi:MAG TPA: DVUA0089 family protein, partial [Pirellulaceae bacterium]
MNGSVNLCSHGTHVAGIAAGSSATDPTNAPANGVAPGARIIAMQIFTRFNDTASCGVGFAPCVLSYTSDQINALNELLALDMANPGLNIVSANMSLGGGTFTSACDTDSRKLAIDALLANGVATAIAAGNNGFTAAVGAPGCISTAFTVGSTTDSDAISSFSNRGVLLDVFAPGSSVTSSVPNDTYTTFNGTSMATPHVAGALALLRQALPASPIADLLQRLKTTGVPISYSSGGQTVVTRRIDLLAALGNPGPADVGDTLASSQDTGIGAGGSFGATSQLGNGSFTTRDVDMFQFTAIPGSMLSATTSLPSGGSSVDTILRLFNASGTQLALNDDSIGLYSHIDFSFTSSGTYYLGVSGYPNSAYNPLTGGSGVPGAMGDYRLEFALSAGDQVPPMVTSTVPTDGSTVSTGPFVIRVNFSEPMDQGPAGLLPQDLSLSGPGLGMATVSGATWQDADTAQFTISGMWGMGQVIVQLLTGYPRDLADNPLVPYTTGDFTIDSTAVGPPNYYLSLEASGTVLNSDGTALFIDDSDIVEIRPEPGGGYRYFQFFDGSDRGLTTAAEDIDAFAILDDGSFLISTVGSFNVPQGNTTITGNDEDLLRFIPSQVGPNTLGTWEFAFDGSAQGLTEDIDALDVLPDGRLVISCASNVTVPGAAGSDKDLFMFTPNTPGNYLGGGTWQVYFSAVGTGLQVAAEDLDALAIGPAVSGVTPHYLSTRGAFSANGISGGKGDIFR